MSEQTKGEERTRRFAEIVEDDDRPNGIRVVTRMQQGEERSFDTIHEAAEALGMDGFDLLDYLEARDHQ